MTFGSDNYTYTVQENWWTLPEGWAFGWIPGVACDSQDRVYVYSRSEHPLMVFDREGHFLEAWGDDILVDAHGIYIDDEFIEDGIVNTGTMQPIARMGYMEYAVVRPNTVFTLNRPEMNSDGTVANSQPNSWDGTYG